MSTKPKQHRETWLPASSQRHRRNLLIALSIASVLVATVIFAIAGMQHSLLTRGETPVAEVATPMADAEAPSGTTESMFFNSDDRTGSSRCIGPIHRALASTAEGC